MKKIRFVAVFMSICMLFSTTAFAFGNDYRKVDDNEAVCFEVTGGLDFTKIYESTFNKSRVVSGIADSGTQLLITLSYIADNGETTEVDSYPITVGVSGLFSQTIDLDIGENLIVVEAVNTKGKDTAVSAVIKRKSIEIKNELESGVALPGVGLVGLRTFFSEN